MQRSDRWLMGTILTLTLATWGLVEYNGRYIDRLAREDEREVREIMRVLESLPAISRPLNYTETINKSSTNLTYLIQSTNSSAASR